MSWPFKLVHGLSSDDEIGRVSGDPSETSSLAYSLDGEEDWIWGVEDTGFVDVQEIRAQLAFKGSVQALREIRSVKDQK